MNIEVNRPNSARSLPHTLILQRRWLRRPQMTHWTLTRWRPLTVLSHTKLQRATGGSALAQAFHVRVKPTCLDKQHLSCKGCEHHCRHRDGKWRHVTVPPPRNWSGDLTSSSHAHDYGEDRAAFSTTTDTHRLEQLYSEANQTQQSLTMCSTTASLTVTRPQMTTPPSPCHEVPQQWRFFRVRRRGHLWPIPRSFSLFSRLSSRSRWLVFMRFISLICPGGPLFHFLTAIFSNLLFVKNGSQKKMSLRDLVATRSLWLLILLFSQNSYICLCYLCVCMCISLHIMLWGL